MAWGFTTCISNTTQAHDTALAKERPEYLYQQKSIVNHYKNAEALKEGKGKTGDSPHLTPTWNRDPTASLSSYTSSSERYIDAVKLHDGGFRAAM